MSSPVVVEPLQAFGDATDLPLTEVLALTPEELRYVSLTILHNGPLEHVQLVNAWRRARKEQIKSTVRRATTVTSSALAVPLPEMTSQQHVALSAPTPPQDSKHCLAQLQEFCDFCDLPLAEVLALTLAELRNMAGDMFRNGGQQHANEVVASWLCARQHQNDKSASKRTVNTVLSLADSSTSSQDDDSETQLWLAAVRRPKVKVHRFFNVVWSDPDIQYVLVEKNGVSFGFSGGDLDKLPQFCQNNNATVGTDEFLIHMRMNDTLANPLFGKEDVERLVSGISPGHIICSIVSLPKIGHMEFYFGVVLDHSLRFFRKEALACSVHSIWVQRNIHWLRQAPKAPQKLFSHDKLDEILVQWLPPVLPDDETATTISNDKKVVNVTNLEAFDFLTSEAFLQCVRPCKERGALFRAEDPI